MSGIPSYEQVAAAADFVRAQGRTIPTIAVILGSGLGDFTSSLANATSLSYDRVPNWPASTVVGHKGQLVLGEMAGRPIVALSGRVHAYEGHDLPEVTFGVRVLGLLGVKTLILTNSAGGVNTKFSVGDLMVIDDHINLIGGNPLVGPNDERFGPRFPDMTEVYSKRLRSVADQAGSALGLALPHGVYVGWHGPSYETPAEIRFLRTIGGDAIGMSTVPEAIVARHMGIEVLGISCITNMAAGVVPRPLKHEEVLETAHQALGRFVGLLQEIISRL